MNNGRVIVLSGGVGGAKLVLGMSKVLPAANLMVVTNTGDDFEHLGLRICPDTDTVLYTLAGLSNTELGWGRAGETWTFMDTLRQLGGPHWFNLGDADLALHVLRTEALKAGKSLTSVIHDIATAMGIQIAVVPMCDQEVQTMVNTPGGQLAFQEYFVRDRCEPRVTGFEFAGIRQAQANPVLTEVLSQSPEAIIIAPSNPYVSVDPILTVPGLRNALESAGVPIVAVSPIVAGNALKGPAAKMMTDLGVSSNVLGIARHYDGLLDGLVIDDQDAAHINDIEALGMRVQATQTVMQSLEDRTALAQATLDFARRLSASKSS